MQHVGLRSWLTGAGFPLINASYDHKLSSWIDYPPPYFTGELYVKAIQLRGNYLPVTSLKTIAIVELVALK